MSKIIMPFILLLMFSCYNNEKSSKDTNKAKDSVIGIIKKEIVKDTTPKVIGIGGVFFGTNEMDKTAEWYSKNLGMSIDKFVAPFETRDANNPNQKNYLIWSIFKNGDDYFKPSNSNFMINYRVQNMEGLVRKLKLNGVNVIDTILNVEYGKFVHILDINGNKIELWEPVDDELTKLGGNTNK